MQDDLITRKQYSHEYYPTVLSIRPKGSMGFRYWGNSFSESTITYRPLVVPNHHRRYYCARGETHEPKQLLTTGDLL